MLPVKNAAIRRAMLESGIGEQSYVEREWNTSWNQDCGTSMDMETGTAKTISEDKSLLQKI